ncbi:DMT family transporter [Tumebacillus flagellatus]|uniref:DMT family transporter n=1 Tax=Tumebacillus flagellatus TaxID=1157490 RepID=UPI0005708025|nr:DMT family transporter [Tumebacillus flagellatus]
MFKRWKGFAMVLTGGMFWGLSGTVAQKLFVEEGFTPGFLVCIRLVVAGALLLLFASFGEKRRQVFGVWKDHESRIRLVVFGLIGMLGVQYTYFASIEKGNAAAATLLQYLAPLLVVVYQAWLKSKLPSGRETLAVAFALVGTLLLVTNGSWHSLSISTAAVVWGLLSAVGLAFNAIYPSELQRKWESTVILGWAMVVGGAALALINRPWNAVGMHWSWVSAAEVIYVVIFGTLVAFYLFIDSLRYVTSTEASLLSIIEPLVAVLASVFWLKVPLGFYEGIGGVCILVTVAILAVRKAEPKVSD